MSSQLILNLLNIEYTLYEQDRRALVSSLDKVTNQLRKLNLAVYKGLDSIKAVPFKPIKHRGLEIHRHEFMFSKDVPFKTKIRELTQQRKHIVQRIKQTQKILDLYKLDKIQVYKNVLELPDGTKQICKLLHKELFLHSIYAEPNVLAFLFKYEDSIHRRIKHEIDRVAATQNGTRLLRLLAMPASKMYVKHVLPQLKHIIEHEEQDTLRQIHQMIMAARCL